MWSYFDNDAHFICEIISSDRYSIPWLIPGTLFDNFLYRVLVYFYFAAFKPKFADPKHSERRDRDRDYDMGGSGGFGGGYNDRETNRFGGGYNDFNEYDSRDRGNLSIAKGF